MLSIEAGGPVPSGPVLKALRLLIILAVATAGVTVASWALISQAQETAPHLVESKPLPLPEVAALAEPSVIYAANGDVMTLLVAENRRQVSLDEVPPIVQQAILDIEDDRFYEHSGVDYRSIARAAATNATAGGVSQGGSTITQQVVKLSLLTPEQKMSRKVTEAVLAQRLEKQWSKREILERYMNMMYLGNGAHGVGAASEVYFGVPIEQLTDPAAAALLAGMIRNPSANDPTRNPVQAMERRETVLTVMRDHGTITNEQYEEAKKAPLPTKVTKPEVQEGYYIENVKQTLLADKRLGETNPERYNILFKGGLKIHTPYDDRIQKAGEKAIREGVPKNSWGVYGALVSVEPNTGFVKAVVGGPGFEKLKLDMATYHKGRQPGSTFKAFTLLAALEAGYGPGSSVDGSSPCYLNSGSYRRGYRAADKISNAGDTVGGGQMSEAAATAGSVNCAYMRMASVVGLEKVREMAVRLGITTPLQERPSTPGGKPATAPTLVLGAKEVPPIQMAGAYAAIANDGVYVKPTFIDHIENRNGQLVLQGKSQPKRVLDPNVARNAAQIMKGALRGGGTASGNGLAGREAAGKTGTTENGADAWFAGYTPQLSTAVWLGRTDNNKSLNGLGGRGSIFGATFSAPIWQHFMNDALKTYPNTDFPAPTSVIPSKAFVVGPGQMMAPGSFAGASTTVKPGAKPPPAKKP